MCDGAEQNPECWTFAYSRDSTTNGELDLEKITPCMVPMKENPNCAEGELCIDIDPEYLETFKEKNYVIPIGASIVCQAKGQTFLRGISTSPVTLRTLETQRSEYALQ